MLRKCFFKIKSEMKHFCERVNKFYLSLICFILYSPFAFASFAELGNQVKKELKGTAGTVMGVLSTVIASVGIVYVCIVGFIFVFKPDTFKRKLKSFNRCFSSSWCIVWHYKFRTKSIYRLEKEV